MWRPGKEEAEAGRAGAGAGNNSTAVPPVWVSPASPRGEKNSKKKKSRKNEWEKISPATFMLITCAEEEKKTEKCLCKNIRNEGREEKEISCPS